MPARMHRAIWTIPLATPWFKPASANSSPSKRPVRAEAGSVLSDPGYRPTLIVLTLSFAVAILAVAQFL